MIKNRQGILVSPTPTVIGPVYGIRVERSRTEASLAPVRVTPWSMNGGAEDAFDLGALDTGWASFPDGARRVVLTAEPIPPSMGVVCDVWWSTSPYDYMLPRSAPAAMLGEPFPTIAGAQFAAESGQGASIGGALMLGAVPDYSDGFAARLRTAAALELRELGSVVAPFGAPGQLWINGAIGALSCREIVIALDNSAGLVARALTVTPLWSAVVVPLGTIPLGSAAAGTWGHFAIGHGAVATGITGALALVPPRGLRVDLAAAGGADATIYAWGR